MNEKYSITKTFKFEAAHRLLSMKENHPCRRIHGHSYVINATITVDHLSQTNPNMVLDFGSFKSFQKYFDTYFDHKIILNNNDPLCNILKDIDDCGLLIMPDNADPTAENMAYLFSLMLVKTCLQDYGIKHGKVSIEVFETVGNSATHEMEF